MNQESETRLDSEAVVGRADGVLEAEIDGETVMMSVEKGEYYGLDSTGSEIWAMLAEPRSVGEICAELTGKYDVEEEECLREVTAFLEDLLSDGTLRIVGR
jgi:hypothetical protein